MQSTNNFRTRLHRWWQHWGFIDDPFAVCEADQEREFLPYLFVDRPYWHDILGNSAHPQTAFLVANNHGEGKTATREMIAYECAHAGPRRRVLVVRYQDFGHLLDQVQGDLAKLTSRHQVNSIAREILKALAEDVPPTFFDQLESTDRALLMGYVDGFASPLTLLKLRMILDSPSQQVQWNALSPLETLQTLSGLVVKLGTSDGKNIQSIYILVDRVDETALGPGAATLLLKSLVSEGPLIETPKVAFKFFLHRDVFESLRQEVHFRADRIHLQQISWTKEDLRRMVEQRLTFFSDSKVQRFEELCTTIAKNTALNRLIKDCENSPRTLLRLCKEVIYRHVDRSEDMLLNLADILDTLVEFTRLRETEFAASINVVQSKDKKWHGSDLGQHKQDQGITLSNSGHIWKNGQILDPPLSYQEFLLFKTLFVQSPHIVTIDVLMEAVWSQTNANQASEQNLRKLINRVRERLDPGGEGKNSRYIRNAKGRGYYLLKE